MLKFINRASLPIIVATSESMLESETGQGISPQTVHDVLDRVRWLLELHDFDKYPIS